MWQSSSNKTSIEEANKHLSAMMEKAEMLEQRRKQLEAELQSRDSAAEQLGQELAARYEREMRCLSQRLAASGAQASELAEQLAAKEHELRCVQERCRMVDELLQYKSVLARMTITLEQVEQFTKYNVNRETYDPRQRPPAMSDSDRLLQRAAAMPNGARVEKELYA